MDINLSLIQGLSREDSLLFQSEAQQATFFESLNVQEIIYNGYFPPHYTNVIKLTRDDIDFTSNYNYLWFDFDGLTYYYFIDDISYVNENVIELHLVLDTLQTFMFHMDIHSAFVERRMIDRWNTDDTINRNYVRENISENDFDLVRRYWAVNPYDVTGFWVFSNWCGEISATASRHTMPGFNYYHDIDGFGSITPQVMNGTPFVVTYTGARYVKKGSNEPVQAKPWLTISRLTGFSEPTNIFVLPFNPFDENDISMDGATLVASGSAGPGKFTFVTHEEFNQALYDGGQSQMSFFSEYIGAYTLDIRGGKLPVKSRIVNFEFGQSPRVKETPFKRIYIPQLLDENYVRLTFGSSYANTEFPLHMLNSSLIKCLYTGSPSDGTRTYWLSDDEGNFDFYSTAVVDDNILYLDMYNDAWNQYIARNRYSLAGKLGNNVVSGILNLGQSVEYQPPHFRKERRKSKKTGKFIKGSKKVAVPGKLGLSKDAINESIGTGIDTAEAVAGTLIDYATTKANLQAAPQEQTKASNMGSTIPSMNFGISGDYYRVKDIDACAYYFHMYGNKVDTLYMQERDGDFLAYLNNRYYFNYVKTTYVDLHLDVLQAQSVTDDLIDRFNSGVRFWNPHSGISIGDYHFDNVENKYL